MTIYRMKDYTLMKINNASNKIITYYPQSKKNFIVTIKLIHQVSNKFKNNKKIQLKIIL